MRRFIQKRLVQAIGLAGIALSLPGYAQQSGGIQEVVVTAQKTEENLQNTPIAITALTSEALEMKGVNSLIGVVAESPSLTFTPYPSASNLMIVYMRGQGVSDPMQVTSDGSVGIYTDGFYLARPQSVSFELADLERVEVLRGPQGTLYGRNTTGGAVNLVSKKPTGEFGFKQQLSFGSLNLFRSVTTIDLPKVANVSTKINLLKSERDGYVKNTGSSHDYGEQGSTAGRLLVNWQPADNFAVDYFFETGKVDTTPLYYQAPSLNGELIMDATGNVLPDRYYTKDGPMSRTYRAIDLKPSTTRFEGHGLTLTWDVSENNTLKSLTGYRTLDFEANQDYAEVFSVLLVPGTGSTPDLYGPPFIAWDEVKEHQFSQEFQLIGSLPDAGIRYVGGLYYFTESTGHPETIAYALNAPGATLRDVHGKATSYAAYAQTTWTPDFLDKRLDLVLGLRFTKDEREASRFFGALDTSGGGVSYVPILPEEDGSVKHKIDSSRFNPSITANFTVNDDINTYFKIATGYKAGGFVESSSFGSFDNATSPEKVTTYEAGLKSYWWDRRVRANVAVFMSKFDDMQMVFQTNPANQAEGSGYNAGKATVQGVEVELLVQPIDDLTLRLDYSWLDPELDEVEALQGTVFDPGTNPEVVGQIVVGQNIKNLFSMPYAPEHSVSAGVDYTFARFNSSDLTASVNYRFQSRNYVTAPTGTDVPGRELYSVDPYGIFDARLTWSVDLPRGDRARIGLWGKNILEKDYQAHVIGLGGTAVAVPGTSAGYKTQAIQWGEPATYGIDIVYEY